MTYKASRPVEGSSSTRTLQQSPKTANHYTKQNHNVSCILYKPQRLRNIKPNHQARYPQTAPLLGERYDSGESLKNLPVKTATIPVPTGLLKLKISQNSQISQSLQRFTTSPKSPSLRYSTIPSIKISRHLIAPLFQCFSLLSISAGKTRISHQNTRKCHQKPVTNDQKPRLKQMYSLFVLLNVKSCHTHFPPQDLTFSTRINRRCLLHHPPPNA